MATPYSDVIDLALVTIRDYKLDALYNQSPTDFAIYMEGFMMKAIPYFTNCLKDLSDRNETSKQFNETLGDDEIGILSDYTLCEWLKSEIFDTRQITGMMQNKKEGNRYSEANLLDKKIILKQTLLEDLDHRQTSYGLKNTPWSEWAVGNYGV